MFDKYIICENSLRPRAGNDAAAGFSLELRLPYYRALGLSMVEKIALTIDGETVPVERMTLNVEDGAFAVADLGKVDDARWGFGEVARLDVEGVTLKATTEGGHDVQVEQHLRISYLPFTLVGKDRKFLALEAALA
ncbi:MULTISPECIES: C-glycoside deglycosidase beta subunit domain-containing protein [unclassified Paraburkholderia]|uniref:C-glycoside deglycosidase beta subunit domain-containing protein n=1 Tax=unclassified Paraburkholderia TaxID=2615204 RepID=UPI002AB0FE7E|nr:MULTISPECIES: DUF6379 domain-containing protein [unclassified Paraburkholderia]